MLPPFELTMCHLPKHLTLLDSFVVLGLGCSNEFIRQATMT